MIKNPSETPMSTVLGWQTRWQTRWFNLNKRARIDFGVRLRLEIALKPTYSVPNRTGWWSNGHQS